MKKRFKKTFLVLSILSTLSILLLVVWAFLIYPKLFSPDPVLSNSESDVVEIAETSENIDFNEDKGILYINNEVIVYTKESAKKDKIDMFFHENGASIDDTMSDIGIYRLILKDAMSYEELENLIEKLESQPDVEKAYLNIVTPSGTDDTKPDEETQQREPVYPNDPWNKASWNISVPRDENWGMEAIEAPGAWAYLDQIETVNIGLIDAMPQIAHEDLPHITSIPFVFDPKTNKTTPADPFFPKAHDHGTHVSGIMNATYNNQNGVCGVMGGKGKLFYSAVYVDPDGKNSPNHLASYNYLLELKTLIDRDVQVINMSLNTGRLIGFAASRGNKNALNLLSMQAEYAERGLRKIIEQRKKRGKRDFVLCVAAGNNNDKIYYKDDSEPYGYRTTMTLWETFKHSFGWRGESGNCPALYNNFLNMIDEESVKNRIIVVGAIGLDIKASTDYHSQYLYTSYSNLGSRVDIVAPGGIYEESDIYSCIVNGYGPMSGTSMATPHVSGVAGLIFGCNPSLSGPEVKEILIASSVGRYYHGDDFSGLLNAKNSVINALKTEKKPLHKILNKETDNGLDLCFVVDTTGSMGDDIDNAKENMTRILEHLAEKTENYRVALIDYRDYSSRTLHEKDYPAKIQLYFTDNNTLISDAINRLDLGNGGDDRETVYSALMKATELKWRNDSKKVIIVLGDAAPLDPEPNSDLTYDSVLQSLFGEDISIDVKNSDKRVIDSLDTSLINVFSIGTDASSAAKDFFEKISLDTGGNYVGVDQASQVSDAIIDSIEQIEINKKMTVDLDFGPELAEQKINLYSGKEYLFTLQTDDRGHFVLEDMVPETYQWTSNALYGGGSIEISPGEKNATVRMTRTYFFSPVIQLWNRHRLLIGFALFLWVTICICIPILIKRVRKKSL